MFYQVQWPRAPPRTRWCWPSSSSCRPPHPRLRSGQAATGPFPSPGQWHTEAPRSSPCRKAGCHTEGGRCWSLGTGTWSTGERWTRPHSGQIGTGSTHSSLGTWGRKMILITSDGKIFWRDDFTRCYWGVWQSCSCHWRQNSFELWFHIYLKWKF